MKLLVYEHVSGGGFADESIPANILSEGFGMLRTLISDFKAAGHNVTTTLDSRIARINPPIGADCVVPVFSSHETQVNIHKFAESADAVYIIAPETGGVLKSFVELIEQTGAASLNCLACSIEKVSDKIAFYESMRKLELPLPEMIIFPVAKDLKEIKKVIRRRLTFPMIFKPSDGVSCSGLSIVRNEEQIVGAVDKIKMSSSNKHLLVQELVEGVAASVSLFSTGSNAVSISLNRQDITIETPDNCSSYSGGVAPFGHPLETKAFEVAEKLVKSVPNLRGYVGVDFVLTENEAVTIEVNPRLTTSYVGLRNVINFNPAQAMVNAVLKRELPTQVKNCGCTIFSKVETPKPTMSTFQETCRMDEVISPPFPISESTVTSALITSHGTTLKEASTKFREAKKRVLNTISRGK